jgi:imidazolonepropionase-like amidohydrolase
MKVLNLLVCFLTAVTAAAQPLAITHVTVIDTTAGPARPDTTVLIRDGRIVSIGQSAPPEDAQILDGHGKYLIPGLFDMHVHLSWTTSSALPLLIANGVTSVRDLGSDLVELDGWRTRIAAGVLVGPRIVRAGPILNGQKFNKYQLVTGNADATRGVARALKQVGVDFLKVHRRMPRDSYFALIDEARTLGLRVVGHIPMTVTPEEASTAGQATIEHVETIFEGTFSASLKEGDFIAAIARFRQNDAAKLFSLFARNGTVVDPTLIAYDIPRVVESFRRADPLLQYVAASQRDAGQKLAAQMTPELLGEEKRKLVEYKEVVRLMKEAGATLVAGTDIAGPRLPGFTLHDELALLVESGLTPLEALQAATITPAKVLGQEKELGSIEAGKEADLVLLDANPLADIHNSAKIVAVVLNGRLFRRADLDGLLNTARALAAKQ